MRRAVVGVLIGLALGAATADAQWGVGDVLRRMDRIAVALERIADAVENKGGKR